MVVLFPAPLSPKRTVISPSYKSMVKLLTARFVLFLSMGKSFVMFFIEIPIILSLTLFLSLCSLVRFSPGTENPCVPFSIFWLFQDFPTNENKLMLRCRWIFLYLHCGVGSSLLCHQRIKMATTLYRIAPKSTKQQAIPKFQLSLSPNGDAHMLSQ